MDVDVIAAAEIRGGEPLEVYFVPDNRSRVEQTPAAREQGERTTIPQAARRRIEKLRTWRDEQAKRSKLDPSTVMSQRLIDRIGLVGPQTLGELAAIEGIRQWRVTEWGAALLAATC